MSTPMRVVRSVDGWGHDLWLSAHVPGDTDPWLDPTAWSAVVRVVAVVMMLTAGLALIGAAVGMTWLLVTLVTGGS